jgi:two-component system, sensor histidine kinase YesM
MNVAEQIEALSELFKHVLNKGKDDTNIRAEIEHLENYILIQENRFGERIRIDIEADPEILDCTTLKLILQPLVENAIQHGLEGKVGGGTILIRIKKDDNTIKYTVIDDGVGTEQEEIRKMLLDSKESHNVFALKNINDRIQHKYGSEYGLNFSSCRQKGTQVEVTIPFIKPEGVEINETANS